MSSGVSAGVCDVMYDYDIVKEVLGVAEIGIPLVFRRDCLGGAIVGKDVRHLRTFLRVFVRESDLRGCVEMVRRMTWGDFNAQYFQELTQSERVL